MRASVRLSACVAVVVAVMAVSNFAQTGQPKVDFAKLGFPADTETQVLAGKFVETSLATASDRDLNTGMAFFVKQPPEKLAQLLRDERLLQRVDPNMIAFGDLKAGGGLAQLSTLRLTPAQAKAYAGAKAGTDLNLSTEEIAALNAVSKDAVKLQDTVRAQLLARFDAYRLNGLAGLAPYARSGSKHDLAREFGAINGTVRKNGVLPAALCDLLDSYPKGAPADLVQRFSWMQFKAHGEDTLALGHSFQGTFAGKLIIVQRHFYVSTGYNVEQAIAGLLPLRDGTLVFYGNHTSTDQVAGFGGGAKRSIGRGVMTGELKKLFEQTRTAAAK